MSSPAGWLSGIASNLSSWRGGGDTSAETPATEVSAITRSSSASVGRESVDVDVLSPKPSLPLSARVANTLQERLPRGPEGFCRMTTLWRAQLRSNPVPPWCIWALRGFCATALAAAVLSLVLAFDLLVTTDLSLGGGWQALFVAISVVLAVMGLLGGLGSFLPIWLLPFLFYLVVIWLVALWLLFFLPTSFRRLEYRLEQALLEGGLWEDAVENAKPGSALITHLSAHHCSLHASTAEVAAWRTSSPKCWQAVTVYIEDQLDIGLWSAVMGAGVFALVGSTFCVFVAVGARTSIEVVNDGMRSMQLATAGAWGAMIIYWRAPLAVGTGRLLSIFILGVAVCLFVVPCCVRTNAGAKRRPKLRRTRLQTLEATNSIRPRWSQARLGPRGGAWAYGTTAFFASICAIGCLNGVGTSAVKKAVHAQFHVLVSSGLPAGSPRRC